MEKNSDGPYTFITPVRVIRTREQRAADGGDGPDRFGSFGVAVYVPACRVRILAGDVYGVHASAFSQASILNSHVSPQRYDVSIAEGTRKTGNFKETA